jgi:hypothetical protein
MSFRKTSSWLLVKFKNNTLAIEDSHVFIFPWAAVQRYTFEKLRSEKVVKSPIIISRLIR